MAQRLKESPQNTRRNYDTLYLEKYSAILIKKTCLQNFVTNLAIYESFATVGEIRVWWRADFQSGSRVLKKVF